MLFLKNAALHLLLAASCSFAFVVVAPPSSSSTSALYISSWGTKGPPAFRSKERGDPSTNLQDYLPEPDAVEARSNVDGVCLVSGLVNAKDRTDQFLFDLLNHQDSAFEFSKITAFVDDAAFSKKRLLSRSARYTGLLDKLDFVQSGTPGGLPSAEQLNGVKSWLAVLSKEEGDATELLIDQCQQVATTLSNAPTVENVAILLTGANEVEAASCQQVVDALAATGKQYTIVAVGKLEDRPEGKAAYHYGTFGEQDAVLPAKAVFSREEAYRMVTELLQLECGVNQALTFAEIYNVNATEVKLIRGLREAGYARPQEIDHMIRKGPKAYLEAIENFQKENPDAAAGYTTNAWWEAEEYKKARERSDERAKEKLQMLKDEKQKEIEEIATQYAKREYFRQSMEGVIDMTEEEFIKSIWDRALFEGDLKYRQIRGEDMDEAAELADFKLQQERKQKAMLERAKKELAAVLREDDPKLPGSGDKKDGDESNDKPKE